MILKRYTVYLILVMVIALMSSGCARKAFVPVWYATTPATAYDLKGEKEVLGSVQYTDADNGGGWSMEGVYSPVKNIAIGLGLQTLGSKGLVYVPEEQTGSSRLWQGNIMGGTYWNLARNMVSLQCYSGFSYASSITKIEDTRHAELKYQKLYLQPAVMFRLPNSMYINASWRFSQLYYTSGVVKVGVLQQEYINEIQKIDLASPFRMQELGLGYTYIAGPLHTGIEYTIASTYGKGDLPTFDYQAITTSLRLNITDLIKLSKKGKAASPVQ